MKAGVLLDAYERRARLVPALITATPVATAVAVWFPGREVWAVILGVLTFAGGGFLLTNLARNAGKRLEPDLFKMWGGNPSVAALRHRSNPEHAPRRHAKLTTLVGDVTLPTAEEEALDPDKADVVYDGCVRYLRANTRDQERFKLLFLENCGYGFWRNLLGLKPLGIITSLSVAAGLGVDIALAGMPGSAPTVLPALVVNVALFSVWLFLVKPATVKVAADAYTERLMEALDQL